MVKIITLILHIYSPIETLAASMIASHLVESITSSSSCSTLSSVKSFREPINRTTYTTSHTLTTSHTITNTLIATYFGIEKIVRYNLHKLGEVIGIPFPVTNRRTYLNLLLQK